MNNFNKLYRLIHTAWNGFQKTHLIIALNPPQSLFMPFGASFYLEKRLERLPIISKKSQEGSRTWAQIAKKIVSAIFYSIKISANFF